MSFPAYHSKALWCGLLFGWTSLIGLLAFSASAQESQPAAEASFVPVLALTSAPAPLSSVFFSPIEREAIDQAKKQFASQDTGEETEADLLDQLQGIKEAKKPEEDLQEKFYAQFYLESLMYHTPNDWTAWVKINDITRKFTPTALASADNSLKVIAIQKEDVMFEWAPKNWLQTAGAYKGADPNVKLDEARRVVIFTLRVNQTMPSYEMIIREGVVTMTPVLPAASKDGQTPLPEGQTRDTSKAAAAVPPVQNTQQKPASSGGILGLYKNLENVDPHP